MKLKICGLNPIRDVQICIDLKVDFLGFVFYKKSPRNVKLKDINILSKYNKKNSSFVAVTVNPTDNFIKEYLLGNFVEGLQNNQHTIELEGLAEGSLKFLVYYGGPAARDIQKVAHP